MKGPFDRVTIMPADGPDGIITGQNCKVFIDEQEITGIVKLNLSVQVGEIAILELKMFVDPRIEGKIEQVNIL
jgi:hypothetical protein